MLEAEQSMSSETITTRQTKYETFWPRLVAITIDGFVIKGVAALLTFYVSPDHSVIAQTVGIIVLMNLGWVYDLTMHGKFAQTLGKMVMKVRVVSMADERPISWRYAMKREALWIVLAIVLTGVSIILGISFEKDSTDTWPLSWKLLLAASILVGFIDSMTALTNTQLRCLHDFIGATVVIRIPDSETTTCEGKNWKDKAKSYFWLVYCWFILILALLSARDPKDTEDVVNGIEGFLFFVAVFSYTYRRQLLPKAFWKGCLFAILLWEVWSFKLTEPIYIVIALIIVLPIFFLLYKLGWATDHEILRSQSQ